MEKRRRRRRGIIKKSGNRAGLSMRRVAGSTQINGRHEGQFFAAPFENNKKNNNNNNNKRLEDKTKTKWASDAHTDLVLRIAYYFNILLTTIQMKTILLGHFWRENCQLGQ